MLNIAESDGMFMDKFNLPPSDVDYNDYTEEQKLYVEMFLCKHIKVYYREHEFYDYINKTPYSNYRLYPLGCHI